MGAQGSDQPTGIGWYASQQPAGYFPAAAGPLAAGNGGKDDDSFFLWGTGRKTLTNVLLFGVVPLVLAGVVAIAYVLSTSGKGHAAASSRFHAAAAASGGAPQVQNAITPAATSSASPHPKPNASLSFPALPTTNVPGSVPGGLTSTHPGDPKSEPAPQHSKTPTRKPSAKPSPKASVVPVPASLGSPNFDGYCASIKEGNADNIGGNADGWRCTAETTVPLSTQAVCGYTYRPSNAQVIDVTVDYSLGFVSAIQCWSTHGEIGALNLSAYCSAEGWGAAVYGANATEVSCKSNATIDETTACQVLYPDHSAFARYADYSVADSWQCWG
jgi:hypothetical protein